MNSAFHGTTSFRQSISWLSLLTFLSLTLFPYHYHLHHDSSPETNGIASYDHVIDGHGLLAVGDSDHHRDSHIIEPVSEFTYKQSNIQLPSLLLILALVMLVPLYRRVSQLRIESSDQKPPGFFRHNTPPLRAPPHG